jgi:hypothetical protein
MYQPSKRPNEDQVKGLYRRGIVYAMSAKNQQIALARCGIEYNSSVRESVHVLHPIGLNFTGSRISNMTTEAVYRIDREDA